MYIYIHRNALRHHALRMLYGTSRPESVRCEWPPCPQTHTHACAASPRHLSRIPFSVVQGSTPVVLMANRRHSPEHVCRAAPKPSFGTQEGAAMSPERFARTGGLPPAAAFPAQPHIYVSSTSVTEERSIRLALYLFLTPRFIHLEGGSFCSLFLLFLLCMT